MTVVGRFSPIWLFDNSPYLIKRDQTPLLVEDGMKLMIVAREGQRLILFLMSVILVLTFNSTLRY